MELADWMNFVGSTFFYVSEEHLALTFLPEEVENRHLVNIPTKSLFPEKRDVCRDGNKNNFVSFFIISIIFPEYRSAQGQAIFDGSQGATLVLYPPDKRCAGDAGRPAPDNWGINSLGLSCKELSHQPRYQFW